MKQQSSTQKFTYCISLNYITAFAYPNKWLLTPFLLKDKSSLYIRTHIDNMAQKKVCKLLIQCYTNSKSKLFKTWFSYVCEPGLTHLQIVLLKKAFFPILFSIFDFHYYASFVKSCCFPFSSSIRYTYIRIAMTQCFCIM